MYDKGECLYNLLPRPPPVIEKQALYRSSFRDTQSQFLTVKTREHATMGLTKEKLQRSPENFVKKRSICKDLPPRARVVPHGNETLNKPPVPRASEIPKLPQQNKRNFIVENWKQAPKTRKLHPEKPVTWYTDKKDYGMAPAYLDRVKDDFRAEAEYWDDVRDSMTPEDNEVRCRLLGEDERMKILEGLNANLTENKRKYASLSFGQDHLSFRRRKEQMENEAAQLEADIKTFSRQNVYITET